MTRSKKRGFTLVELLVVIAILAILATVSVVGYTKFTKKAKQSNDVSLTTQINTALQADEITGKPATLTEAIKVMDEVGANIAKLSPTTEGYSYVWNSKTNRVVLLDEKKGIVAPEGAAIENELDCFAIIHKAADLKTWEGYSYYLAEDYTDEFPALTYLAGVDVGTREIENISITSDSAGTVIVYTNGGTLTVNASNATVNHYGTAESVDIQAIYEKSYHEYGTITGNITIAKGHFVAEAKSSAAALIVTASNGTVSVELKVNSKIAAVAGTGTNGLEGVTITGAQNTTVYEGQYTETTDFAGGLGTEASPWLIETAEQFLNIGNYSDAMATTAYYFSLAKNIDLSAVSSESFKTTNNVGVSRYFRGALYGNNYSLISNDNINYIFGDIKGAALIENVEYKLISKNVPLCLGICPNSSLIYDNVDISTREADSVILLEENEGLYSRVWVGYTTTGYQGYAAFKIINCDCSVNITGVSRNAVFIGGGMYYSDAVVENCTYSGTYTGEYVNLVLGNSTSAYKSTLIIKNVKNEGMLLGTARVPLMAGGNSVSNASFAEIDDSCSLGINRYLYDNNLNILLDSQTGELLIDKAQDSSAYTYILTFTGGTRFHVGENSENSSYRFSFELKGIEWINNRYNTGFKDGKFITKQQYLDLIDSTETFASATWTSVYGEEESKFCVLEHEDTVYYVFDFVAYKVDGTLKTFEFGTKGDDGYTGSAVNINEAMITVYDESGLPIAQKTISLK